MSLLKQARRRALFQMSLTTLVLYCLVWDVFERKWPYATLMGLLLVIDARSMLSTFAAWGAEEDRIKKLRKK